MSGYCFLFHQSVNCEQPQKSHLPGQLKTKEQNQSRTHLWRHRAGGNSAESISAKGRPVGFLGEKDGALKEGTVSSALQA